MPHYTAHDIAAGLRELADFYDQAADTLGTGLYPINVYISHWEMPTHKISSIPSEDDVAESPRAKMARLIRTLKEGAEIGRMEKDEVGTYLYVRRRFGPRVGEDGYPVRLEFSFDASDTCELVEDGTETKVVELKWWWVSLLDIYLAQLRPTLEAVVEVPKFRRECGSLLSGV